MIATKLQKLWRKQAVLECAVILWWAHLPRINLWTSISIQHDQNSILHKNYTHVNVPQLTNSVRTGIDIESSPQDEQLNGQRTQQWKKENKKLNWDNANVNYSRAELSFSLHFLTFSRNSGTKIVTVLSLWCHSVYSSNPSHCTGSKTNRVTFGGPARVRRPAAVRLPTLLGGWRLGHQVGWGGADLTARPD